MLVFLNNKFIEEENALVSVKERAFRFGDGIFETIRVESSVLYQFSRHLERLQHSVDSIKIVYDCSALAENCLELVRKNRLEQGFIRISVSRGIGGKGYLPDVKAKPTIIIETIENYPVSDAPIDLWISDIRKIPHECLPADAKTMQGLNSALARMQAQENDCFEALLLSMQEKICECSSGNIFWFKNGILYTPALDIGILPGTIRQKIIELSPYPVTEGLFSIEDIKNAEEIFITNVAWLALPVKTVKNLNIELKNTKVGLEFKNLLKKDIEQHAITKDD